MKLNPALVRNVVRFLAAGAVGLALHKAEKKINAKTEEMFPDEKAKTSTDETAN